MATQADLVRAVLEELVVTGAGETIDPDDDALVRRRYVRVLNQLARKFLVDWESADTIPDDALDGIALLVADNCAPAFGLPKSIERHNEGTSRLWDYRQTPWKPLPAMKVSNY